MEKFDPIICKHNWQFQAGSQTNSGNGGLGHDYSIHACKSCGTVKIHGRFGNVGVDVSYQGTSIELAKVALKTAQWFNREENKIEPTLIGDLTIGEAFSHLAIGYSIFRPHYNTEFSLNRNGVLLDDNGNYPAFKEDDIEATDWRASKIQRTGE
jgi:hypothetical protein